MFINYRQIESNHFHSGKPDHIESNRQRQRDLNKSDKQRDRKLK